MRATVWELVEAFDHLYEALNDKNFSKSLRFNERSERKLLPLVRTFLLGWFGKKSVSPEHWSPLPGARSRYGRIDFLVGGVAVELAVRCKGGPRQTLSDTVNTKEAKKLMKHPGLALLVLFDFSDDPLEEEKIERFREWPSLGKGNHRKSPFNVSYHFTDPKDGKAKHFKKNISVI